MSPLNSLEHLKSLSNSYQTSRQSFRKSGLDVPSYSSHLSSRSFSIDEGSTIASLQSKYNESRLHSAGDSSKISSLRNKYGTNRSNKQSMTTQIVPVRSIKKSGSLEESSNITSLKTITKLQAEIQKLKAISAFTKAEYEENFLTMNNDTEMAVESMQAQTEDALKENEAVKAEIKRWHHRNEEMEKIEKRQEEELLKIQEENDELEKSLEEAIEIQRSHAVKYEKLEAKIKQVKPMLNNMKEQQDKLMMTSKQLLNSYEKECHERKKKFQKVMTEEDELNRDIFEGTGKEVGGGLEKNYMAMKTALNRLR